MARRARPSSPGLRLLLPVAAALALATAPAASGDEGVAWDAEIRVAFERTAADVPAARVDVRLRALRDGKPAGEGEVPARVEVSMARDGFPGGYGAHVWGFGARAVERDAKFWLEEPLEPEHGRYLLFTDAGGAVRYSYGVLLRHDPTGWAPGAAAAPRAFQRGVCWTGRALFLLPDSVRGVVTLVPREGEEVATSLEPVEGERHRYRFASAADLRERFLAAGDLSVAEVRVGDATVRIAADGPASLQFLRERVKVIRELAVSAFGEAGVRRGLVVSAADAHASDRGTAEFGADVSLRPVWSMDGLGDPGPLRRWLAMIDRSLLHHWFGSRLRVDPRQAWLKEGFAEYFADAFRAREPRHPDPDVRHRTVTEWIAGMEERVRRYLPAAGTLDLEDAGDDAVRNRALVFDGGCLAALCLDVHVRASSAGARRLEHTVRALLAPRDAEAGFETVAELLSSAAGAPSAALLHRLARTRGPLPLEDAFRALGLGLEVTRGPLPTLEWCLETALGVRAADPTPDGIHVLGVNGEGLRFGDRVRGIDGKPLASLDDLRLALRGRRPGDEARLLLERGPRVEEITLVLGGTPGSDVPTEQAVAGRLRPADDATPAQRALLDAILSD